MSNRVWQVMVASLLGTLDGACKECSTLQCSALSNPLPLAVALQNLDAQPPKGASSHATNPYLAALVVKSAQYYRQTFELQSVK